MPPYTPPSTHYSQMDVSEYTDEQIFSFIGKNGKRFYWLTQKLGLDYLWYDRNRKKIEMWGPYYTHLHQQSAHLIQAELEYYFSPKLEEHEHVINNKDDFNCSFNSQPPSNEILSV